MQEITTKQLVWQHNPNMNLIMYGNYLMRVKVISQLALWVLGKLCWGRCLSGH